MPNFTVVFDANVLYPAGLRDLLMRVALTDQFHARWTEDIHDEWTRNLIAKDENCTKEKLKRTVELMNAAVPDCLVTGYKGLIGALKKTDEKDRHVAAAAIRCNADVIVTYNLKDFSDEELKEYHIDAQHPDVFLGHLFDLNPTRFCNAVREHRASLKKYPRTVDELLEGYLKYGLTVTVSKLKDYVEVL